MEIHSGWCGCTTAVVPTLKKLHWDMVMERAAAVQFVVEDRMGQARPEADAGSTDQAKRLVRSF